MSPPSSPLARLATALADRYRIERELGAGGMATVYLAHDLRHDRHVALKVLRPELAAILGADRFLAEIKTTANLQHPHILSLFDSGEADGMVFYVMPYVEGESLRDRLKREHQLPVEEALGIAREVADALEYAHRHGIIHRDIKPENILLHGGHALVADFGIALAAARSDGGSRMTETGMSLGTPHYMAPEQAMGEREITARADVYALGCVLYEMLSGEPPFTGATAQAIIAKVMTEVPHGLTLHRKTILPHVEAAVLTALEKLPADRFGSAAGFAEALARPGAPMRTGQAPFPLRAGRDGPTWRRIAGAVGMLAAGFAALAAWAWLRPRPAAPVGRLHVLLHEFELSTGTAALAITPDGTRLVYGDRAGRLLLRDLDRFEAVPVPGGDNGWSPAFSPDGERLVFNTGFPGALRMVSLAGGTATTLVADSAHAVGSAWSGDGWVYYIGSDSGRMGLMRVRADGGTPQFVAGPDPARNELFYTWPFILPGDRAALIAIRRPMGGADIAVVDIASGAVTVLTGGIRALYAESGHLIVVQADGSLLAVPFDPDRRVLRGRPTRILHGIAVGGNGVYGLALSATGTLIYQTATPEHQVVRVRRDGGVQPVDGPWTGRFEQLDLSPDGRRLAVVVEVEGRVELWVKSLDTGPLTRLAFGGTYAYRPSWTPDGRGILFISDISGRPALYRVRADGGGTPVPVREAARAVDEGSFSRDGRWLVFRTGSGSGRDIFAIRPGVDSTPLPLATTEFEEYSPVLSPDGRWLAYGSDESRRSEVYVRPFPDAAAAKYQVSRQGGTEPVWARSGRELFYRNAAGELVAVAVAPGPVFRAGAERVLFSAREYLTDNRNRNYTVSPDDRAFLFVRPQVGALAQIVVVMNWFEELKTIVGQ